jgi:hypothetical protein
MRLLYCCKIFSNSLLPNRTMPISFVKQIEVSGKLRTFTVLGVFTTKGTRIKEQNE